jgi:hypothetical protein
MDKSNITEIKAKVTIDDITAGVSYKVISSAPLGYFIIDETGEEVFYWYNLFE